MPKKPLSAKQKKQELQAKRERERAKASTEVAQEKLRKDHGITDWGIWGPTEEGEKDQDDDDDDDDDHNKTRSKPKPKPKPKFIKPQKEVKKQTSKREKVGVEAKKRGNGRRQGPKKL